jgi:prevent-host-death family protein
MINAGIKDLKNRLSDYLRQVKKGEKILIAERMKLVALIEVEVLNYYFG